MMTWKKKTADDEKEMKDKTKNKMSKQTTLEKKKTHGKKVTMP